MIKTILFDLDGTLLPMDQEKFTKAYFGLLAKKLASRGYEPDSLVKGIWKGTAAMVKNDGSRPNEEAFWDCFEEIFGERVRADKPYFDEFYRTEFQQVQAACGFSKETAALVNRLKQEGYRLALATNPIFPAVATESRIRWAGLSPEDFELYTTYENSTYCKPNLSYYRELLQKLGAHPRECLMVGNDMEEDMVAGQLGMETFLLTDCLINRENKPLPEKCGSWKELGEILDSGF